MNKRHPKLISLLDQFRDGQGNLMSKRWLKPAEKRARKEKAKRNSLATVFGSIHEYDDLAQSMDKRAMRMLHALAKQSLDVREATIAQIEEAAPRVATVMRTITAQRMQMVDIEALLVIKHNLKPLAAQREAYSIRNLLTAAGRARLVGGFLEKLQRNDEPADIGM